MHTPISCQVRDIEQRYRCPETKQVYNAEYFQRSKTCSCCPRLARVLVAIGTAVPTHTEVPDWTDFAAWAD